MGLLSDDLINGTPEEEFAFNVLQFSKNYDDESWEALYKYAKENFVKNDRKLCWKKYHYFAITRPGTKKHRWDGKNWVVSDAPKKIIIASESLIHDSWGRYDCTVFRCTGKTGPKEKRGRWFRTSRSQENPVLSSGSGFNSYDIYRIPADLIKFLWDFLPHQSKNDSEND